MSFNPLDDFAPYEDPVFDEPGERTPSPLDIEFEPPNSRDPFAGGAAIPGQFNVRPLPVGGSIVPASSGNYAGSPTSSVRNIPQHLPGGAPYRTIDVQAEPIVSEPPGQEQLGSPVRIPLSIPQPPRRREFNAPRPFEARPQNEFPGPVPPLPLPAPSVSPAGLSAGQLGDFGQQEIQPQGVEGEEYIVYASWKINVFRASDGVLLNVREEPYEQRGPSEFPGPIRPNIVMDLSNPPGTNLTIGILFGVGASAGAFNFLTGGGFNTDLQLVDFVFGINPVAGEVAFPREAVEPPRGDRFPPLPFPLPLPPAGSPPLPAPLPAPAADGQPEDNNPPSLQAIPAPAPAPAPSRSPFPGSAPPQPPSDFPAPIPQLPAENPNRPPVPPLPPVTGDCVELRECLSPTFRDILVDELRSQIIDRFLDRLLEGSCSLPEICDKIEDVLDLLLASDRIQFQRNVCRGNTLTTIRPGRRIENIIPAIQSATGWLQDLIEERNPCRVYRDAILLDSGTATRGREVSYVALPNQVKEVELTLPGNLPASLRLYRVSTEGEEQTKFGAIQYAYRGLGVPFSVASPQAWVWTRGTVLEVPEFAGRDRFIRVFLEPGLQWQLWDTGLRIV